MPVQIAENVYWVGAVDWEVRNFHGHTYHTHRGTSYNAYLIVDDRIALVDTVMPGFEKEMFRRIAEIVDPARIDYLIANHGELDHSGAIPASSRISPFSSPYLAASIRAFASPATMLVLMSWMAP